MTRSDELTGKLLDGTLLDAEWAELECSLISDPTLEQDHLALMDLEAALRGLRTEFDLSEPTLARVKSLRDETTTRAVMAEISTLSKPTWAPMRRRRGRLAAAGLIAIAAGIFLGIWISTPEDKTPPGAAVPEDVPVFAKLTRIHGAVELLAPSGDVKPATEGGDVPPGHTLRTVGEESVARVELPDRTTVDIEPDSVVRFLATGDSKSKPRLFLAVGQLIAAVPELLPERQLVVGTGVAEVFTRKGRFVVSSAGPESARVDIKQGKVEVVRSNVPTRVAVDRGSAVMRAGFEKVYLEPDVRVDHTPVRTLTFPAAHDAVFSPDGSEIWVASGRKLTRWTRDGGTADIAFPARKGTTFGPFAHFTRDRRLLVAGSPILKDDKSHRDEKVVLRDIPGGTVRAEVDVRLPEPRSFTLAPDASWFALLEPRPSKRIRVIDTATGGERFMREFRENVTGLASSPDGTFLAATLADVGRGANSKIVLISAATGERIVALPSQRKGMATLMYSADGRFLAAGFNGVVQVWDVRSRELVRSINGFERVVTSLAFTPDGKGLAAGTQDGQVWLWSIESGRPLQLIEAGGRAVRSLSFSPDGKRLVTLANNAPVSIWDVAEQAVPGSSD